MAAEYKGSNDSVNYTPPTVGGNIAAGTPVPNALNSVLLGVTSSPQAANVLGALQCRGTFNIAKNTEVFDDGDIVLYDRMNAKAVKTAISNTNAVQTLSFTDAGSGSGSFNVTLTNRGSTYKTGEVTFSGTAATLKSNLQTALDTLVGAGRITVGGSAITAITLTFPMGIFDTPMTPAVIGNGMTNVTVAVTATTAGTVGTVQLGRSIGAFTAANTTMDVSIDTTGV